MCFKKKPLLHHKTKPLCAHAPWSNFLCNFPCLIGYHSVFCLNYSSLHASQLQKDSSFCSLHVDNQEESKTFVSATGKKNKYEFCSKVLNNDHDTSDVTSLNPKIQSVALKQTKHGLPCSQKQRHSMDKNVFQKNHSSKHTLNPFYSSQQKQNKAIHHSLPNVLDHPLLESLDHLSEHALKGCTQNLGKLRKDNQSVKPFGYKKCQDKKHLLASLVKDKSCDSHSSTLCNLKHTKHSIHSNKKQPVQEGEFKKLISSIEKHTCNARRCTLPYRNAFKRDPKPIACRLYQKRFTAVMMQDWQATVTRFKNPPDIDFVHRLKDNKSYAPYVRDILQLLPKKHTEQDSYHSLPSCKINSN